MEHINIKPSSIYINVNNLGLPNAVAHSTKAISKGDPYDIQDLKDQSLIMQPPGGHSLSNLLTRLMQAVHHLLRSIRSRLNDDESSPSPHVPHPGHGSGQPGHVSNPPVCALPGNGSSGKSSVNGFSTQPQTRAYTQDETRAMGKQITESLMKDLGISRTQAAGIVGNLMQESGLNPSINQGGKIGKPDPSAPGYGWVQWSGPRRKEYENFARQQGLDPGSPAANYAFLVKELTGPYSGVLNRLKQTSSVADAARIIFAEYEIPGDGSLPVRTEYANQSLAWA